MDEEKALKFLLRKADEAEIYYMKEESNKVSIRGGEVEIFEGSSASGYGIRVINKKRMGFTYSNTLDEKTLTRALEIAKISEEDEYISLPKQGSYPRVKGGFDVNIRSLEIEDAVELAKTLIEPCEKYGVLPASGGSTWSTYEVRVANSKGVWGEEKGTVCSCYLNAVARGNGVSTGMEYMSSRNLDLDFASIGEAASKLARDSLGARKIGSLEASVVLKPNAVAELLESVLVPSLSADNVQRGRSYLGDKLNKKVFSDFDVVDHGTKPRGLNTSKFDSEGVASQRTTLVKDGVLKGFLYDTYSANKASMGSTGNAQRGSYSSLPYIDATNLVLSGPGGIEGDGLVVNGLIGAHTSNPVSGDFSLETRNAFYQSKPIKKALIAGNIYELLRNIKGFGRDVKQVGSVVTPSIEFSNVKIMG
jgi:PmbA protein